VAVVTLEPCGSRCLRECTEVVMMAGPCRSRCFRDCAQGGSDVRGLWVKMLEEMYNGGSRR
jgi:hypothetical protein